MSNVISKSQAAAGNALKLIVSHLLVPYRKESNLAISGNATELDMLKKIADRGYAGMVFADRQTSKPLSEGMMIVRYDVTGKPKETEKIGKVLFTDLKNAGLNPVKAKDGNAIQIRVDLTKIAVLEKPTAKVFQFEG